MKILKSHQEAVLQYLQNRFQGALLLDMRLGKNLCIIRHLSKVLNLESRILFITQYGAIQSIEDELISENITVVSLTGTRKKRLKLLEESRTSKGWVISNYESAKRLDLHREDWKAVILDETIKISNPKSQVTKYFLSESWKKVVLRYILNGKVNPENIFQICCQFLFLHGHYMGCKSFWAYRVKYFIQTSDWDWTPKPGHKQQVHDYIHKNAFVLLRKDLNIGPDKVYQKRYVEMNIEQKKCNTQLVEDFELGEVSYKNDLGVQIGLSYLAGGMMPDKEHNIISDTKLKELHYLINNEVEGKVLIWCRFRAEVKLINEFLFSKGIISITITGDLTKEKRQEFRKDFESGESFTKVAILTIASSCKGTDWSMADTSIYYSNEWSNDMRCQSEDRLVHLEKKNPILIIDLITKDSIDEDVVNGLRSKEFDSNLILGNYLSKFSRQESLAR